MIRFAWLGFRLFALVIVAVWLSNHPGKVAINWQGYLVETSVGALIVLTVGSLLLIVLLSKVFRDLLRLPQRWARHRQAQTDRRGRKALTGGLAAVASGDAEAARRLSRQTEATIVDPVLSHLLTAEALILSGENDAAESQFELLLGREDTRVIGHRGLIEVALARGDWARAYSRARQARATMPKSPWLATLLVDLAARTGDLEEARITLDHAVRTRLITGAEAQRRQTALWTAQALRLEKDGNPTQALVLVEKALGEDPGFVPAAVVAARLNCRDDRSKTAERLVQRAWALETHPELVQAWRGIGEGNDGPALALWMKGLAEARNGHPGAALAYAEAAIDARLWAEARRVLEPVAATLPTAEAGRACLLLGRLEREETGNLTAAVAWYERAATGCVPDSHWTCHACGHPTLTWSEICPACGAFAEIQSPERERRAQPARATHASLPGIGTPLSAAAPRPVNDATPHSPAARISAAP